MNGLLESLATAFHLVLQTTLQATVLVGLILVVQRLLRKRLAPRWRYALWLLLLVRLFLPWTPESPTSLFNWVRTERVAPAMLISDEPAPALAEFAPPPEAPFLPGESITPIPEPVPAPALGWRDGSRLGWLGIAIALLLYVIATNGRLWWRVRNEPAIDKGPAADELAACERLMGVRAPVRLIRTRQVTTPALLGLFRPRLLLPEAMAKSLSVEELHHIFLHELAHYRRGDLAANWFMLACNVVHWFNPALWFAFHRMRADRELACDALAMSFITPGENTSYGRTLLRMLEHVASSPPLPGLVGVLESRSHLKRRIRGIAGFRPGSYRWSLFAVAIIAVVSAVALTNARAKENGPEQAIAPQDEPPQMDTLTGGTKAIDDVSGLGQTAGLDPVSEPFANVEDTSSPRVPVLEEDAAAVVAGTDPSSQAGSGSVIQRLPEKSGAQHEPPKSLPATSVAASFKPVELQLPNYLSARFADTVGTKPFWGGYDDASRTLKKIPLDGNPFASGTSATVGAKEYGLGPYRSLALNHPRFKDATIEGVEGFTRTLLEFNDPFKELARTQDEGEKLSVSNGPESTDSDLPARTADGPPQRPAPSPELLKALEQPVSIEFDREHLLKILSFIETYAGVKFQIDEGAIPTSGTDLVPYVKLEHVPLKDALGALLRPLNLRFTVEGNVIRVSAAQPNDVTSAGVPAPATNRVERNSLSTRVVSFKTREPLTLRVFVDQLAESADVNIVVDNRAIPEDVKLQKLDWLVSPVSFKKTAIGEILRQVLEPHGLTFADQRGFIWISTADLVSTESFDELESRTYALEKILPPRSDAREQEERLALVRRAVTVREPVTGKALSSVRVDREHSTIVIHSATQYLNELEQLLSVEPVSGKPADPGKPAPQPSPPKAAPAEESGNSSAAATAASSVRTPRYDIDLRVFRLPKRHLANVLRPFAEVDGATVLYGEPEVYRVPRKPDWTFLTENSHSESLTTLRVYTSLGSSAAYELSRPNGVVLPGFDLASYFGRMPNKNARLGTRKPDGSFEEKEWPSRPDTPEALADRGALLLPGLEEGPNRTLALELLCETLPDSSRPEHLPQAAPVAAFVKYPTVPGEWTAIAYPEFRTDCIIVFAHVEDVSERDSTPIR